MLVFSQMLNFARLRLARMLRIYFPIGVGLCWLLGWLNADLAAQGSANFVDRSAELGIQPGGLAACWVDLDRDGWSDLCAGGTVWKNEQGKRFTQLATGVGEVLAADVDNDGFPDLCSWSNLTVYRNDQGKAFTPLATLSLPPDQPRTVSLGASVGDFNRDGWVDLYVGGFEDWENQLTFPDLLYLNEGGKSFRLAWHDSRHRARGVTSCDFDQDSDLDVYVSNYRLQPNQLWLNDGQANFADAADRLNAVGTTPEFGGGHTIGSAWGDFNSDGLFDLFVGNFAHVDRRGDQPKSRFLRNQGSAAAFAFEDLGPCGVFYQESYASPAAADFDNDGDLDLYFTTVYETASFGKKNNPVLFRNEGNWTFSDQTESNRLANLPATYQAAWSDFDHDGDLDLLTAGKLFVNESAPGNWLQLNLIGNGSSSNRAAIGAQARVQLADRAVVRQVEAGTGQGNQNDFTLHFGLGSQTEPVVVEVQWPDGTSTRTAPLAVRQIHAIEQPK
ncbi:MAG: CRTAC1 family protein [Planctomycetota bacterium]